DLRPMKVTALAPLALAVSLTAHADFPPLGANTAIEYYHAGFDHYFLTSLANEIQVLDSGQLTGWQRTGRGFSVFAVPPASVAFPIASVCRFYVPPEHGHSHFFSASAAECAAIRAKIGVDPNYSNYVEESSHVFYVAQTDFGTGACPAGYGPVYR